MTASMLGISSSIGVNSRNTWAIRGADPKPPPATIRNPMVPVGFYGQKPDIVNRRKGAVCLQPEKAILNLRGRL